MNTKSIPGFTAETSLHKTGGRYQTRRSAFNSRARIISGLCRPAMMREETINLHGCAPGSTLWEGAGGSWGCTPNPLTEPLTIWPGGWGTGGSGGGGADGGPDKPPKRPRVPPLFIRKTCGPCSPSVIKGNDFGTRECCKHYYDPNQPNPHFFTECAEVTCSSNIWLEILGLDLRQLRAP